MPGRISMLLALILSAQSPLDLGKAAMDAHDPTSAITHFESVDTREGRAWLAVALMMESRSPSDQYVERAFDAAARARAERPERLQSRADLAAALGPDEIVVATLVAEKHAYAWAFDRNGLVGYPLPSPADIAAAVERVNAYLAQEDDAGAQRIADELMPALLGPVLERMPSITRVIFVMDGSLQRLPVERLLAGRPEPALNGLAVSRVDDESQLEEMARTPPARPRSSSSMMIAIAVVAAIAILAAAIVIARRRRSSVA